MAYSRVFYSADGSTKDFVFGFNYIDRSHIKVYLDGNLVTNWVFLTSNSIRFDTEPTGIVLIRRSTSVNARLVDYTSPSSLNEADLDLDSLQAFYLAQEAIDETEATIGEDSASGQFDASGKRIVNLGLPEGDNDAVTKRWVEDTFTTSSQDAIDAASEAAASASAASISNDTAQTARDIAVAAQGAAEEARDIAVAAAGSIIGAGTGDMSKTVYDPNNDGIIAIANGGTGATTYAGARSSLGLDNVNNTSDADKPVSTAQQSAIDLKSNILRSVNTQTSSSYALVVSDVGKYVRMTYAGAKTIIVPLNATHAIAIGSQLDIAAFNGDMTVTKESGSITINGSGLIIKSGKGGTLVKVATNEWDLFGGTT